MVFWKIKDLSCVVNTQNELGDALESEKIFESNAKRFGKTMKHRNRGKPLSVFNVGEVALGKTFASRELVKRELLFLSEPREAFSDPLGDWVVHRSGYSKRDSLPKQRNDVRE